MAKGLATREPFATLLSLFSRMVDEIMLVSDDEIAAVIRLLVNTSRQSRQVAERAGAVALTAATQRHDKLTGKNIGLILRSGNITVNQMTQIIRGEMP
jgi:threonine dehydratase